MLLAVMAGEASVQDARAVAVGARIEEQAKATWWSDSGHLDPGDLSETLTLPESAEGGPGCLTWRPRDGR